MTKWPNWRTNYWLIEPMKRTNWSSEVTQAGPLTEDPDPGNDCETVLNDPVVDEDWPSDQTVTDRQPDNYCGGRWRPSRQTQPDNCVNGHWKTQWPVIGQILTDRQPVDGWQPDPIGQWRTNSRTVKVNWANDGQTSPDNEPNDPMTDSPMSQTQWPS